MNATIQSMRITSNWQSYTPDNNCKPEVASKDDLRFGPPVQVLKIDADNCWNSRTTSMVQYQASYDVFDRSGNYFANCTFTVTGNPTRGGGAFWEYYWTHVAQKVTCTKPVNAVGNVDNAHVSFVAMPIINK